MSPTIEYKNRKGMAAYQTDSAAASSHMKVSSREIVSCEPWFLIHNKQCQYVKQKSCLGLTSTPNFYPD